MQEQLTVVMSILSFLATLCVLATFVITRRKESMAAGARQADLDNAIARLGEIVERLIKLKLWLELLLQQHNANHGQDIRR
jgi:hypothetical protein